MCARVLYIYICLSRARSRLRQTGRETMDARDFLKVRKRDGTLALPNVNNFFSLLFFFFCFLLRVYTKELEILYEAASRRLDITNKRERKYDHRKHHRLPGDVEQERCQCTTTQKMKLTTTARAVVKASGAPVAVVANS